MKLTVRSKAHRGRGGMALGLAFLAASPLACSTPTTDLPIDDMCVSMGLDRYEFAPIGEPPIGSFEPESEPDMLSAVTNGMLLVDDDDLTDDYRTYLAGRALYDELKGDYAREIEIYEAIGDKPSGEWTEEERAASEKLRELTERLTEICWNYPTRNNTPAAGVAPLFLSCKDAWNEPGDGVVGLVSLTRDGASDQDRKLAECSTVTGAPNTQALNFWGPVSTRATGWKDQELPYDGLTFSGLTVPVSIATYGRTADLSDWEGVAFWARLANADEAVPLDGDTLAKPLPRKEISPQARPMDGAGQLSVIIQTIDTAAIDPDGRTKFYTDSECTVTDGGESVTGPCFPTREDFDSFRGPALEEEDSSGNSRTYKWGLTDAHGRPADIPQPFCIDYSPVDAVAGEEAPFRNQCWDGFRWMLEITSEWKFYFIPFSQMRQAGWGQVAPRFRTEQVRSVNFLTSPFQSANMMVDEVSLYRHK